MPSDIQACYLKPGLPFANDTQEKPDLLLIKIKGFKFIRNYLILITNLTIDYENQTKIENLPIGYKFKFKVSVLDTTSKQWIAANSSQEADFSISKSQLNANLSFISC
jgi:hypothetical protein